MNDKILRTAVVFVILGILVYMASQGQDPGASWQAIIVLVLGGVFFKGKPPEKRKKPPSEQRKDRQPYDHTEDKEFPEKDRYDRFNFAALHPHWRPLFIPTAGI